MPHASLLSQMQGPRSMAKLSAWRIQAAYWGRDVKTYAILPQTPDPLGSPHTNRREPGYSYVVAGWRIQPRVKLGKRNGSGREARAINNSCRFMPLFECAIRLLAMQLQLDGGPFAFDA